MKAPVRRPNTDLSAFGKRGSAVGPAALEPP